jgi:hypothetical protein
MSQNHRKLVAFQKTEALVPEIYALTADFPQDGHQLQAQMRRGCLAVLANIVEGAIVSGLDAAPSEKESGPEPRVPRPKPGRPRQ